MDELKVWLMVPVREVYNFNFKNNVK